MRYTTKKTLLSYAILVLLFLYIPILTVIVFSFNDSKLGTVWTGFTFDSYLTLFSNPQIMNAFFNSMYVALITTFISCVIGTIAALALNRYSFPGKRLFELLYYFPVFIPEIVVGIALLLLYGSLNMQLGLSTIIPGHVAITMPYVMFIVLARIVGFDNSLEEAAKDLGANSWNTFWKVTFPLISPGLIAGTLLAFTISLDEFAIAFFTTGPGSDTLPVLVYSMIRKGVSPEINALSAILIVLIVIVMLIVGKRIFNTKGESS